MELCFSDVAWHGIRHLDPNFRTFLYQDTYYKAILPTAENWLLSPNSKSLFHAAAKSGFIPPMEKADITIKGFLTIYRQQTDRFSVLPFSFAPEMLKDTALAYLDFNLWLYRKNFGLVDGHYANFILQNSCDIRWCDVGSIFRLTKSNAFMGLDQFIEYFLFPLLLRAKMPSSGDLMRYFAKERMRYALYKEMSQLETPLGLTKDRLHNLSILRELVQSLDFQYPKTAWSDYSPPSQDEDARQTSSLRAQIVERILQEASPATVVDIGANSGFFSRLAARAGAEVLSLDPDEAAVDQQYIFLRDSKFSGRVKPMVGDLEAATKQPAEFALALALTHHLYLSQLFPWAYISDMLSQCATQYLLTEYMPNGLSVGEPTAALPPGYALQVFHEQLLRFFVDVEIIEYDTSQQLSPRIFLFCKNKREVPLPLKTPRSGQRDP